MGCCFSVDSEASKLEKKQQNGFSHESRAPPPPSAEEETVKEVLSETPNRKPKTEPVLVPGGDIKPEVEEIKDLDKAAVFAKIQETHHQHHRETVDENAKGRAPETNEENMSEASEICSLSLSMSISESVSTATVTDKRDNNEEEHEVSQQPPPRVSRRPAKLQMRNREYGVRRDRVVGQSPSRRSEQSPGKRSFNNGSVRLVQSKEESGQPTVRRVGSKTDPRRRDPGECSGRRSRSPATTRSGTMNRSPSTRRTNQSPVRVKNDPTESGSKKVEFKWPINHNQNNNNNCSTNESLENPLVSMECFIFL